MHEDYARVEFSVRPRELYDSQGIPTIAHKNIFDVKICGKYIYSYVILCKNGCETSKCRWVNSFITFVNTYSDNYGKRKKNQNIRNSAWRVCYFMNYAMRFCFKNLRFLQSIRYERCFVRKESSISRAFAVSMRTEHRDRASFCPFALREISVLAELATSFTTSLTTSFCKAFKFAYFKIRHGLKLFSKVAFWYFNKCFLMISLPFFLIRACDRQ